MIKFYQHRIIDFFDKWHNFMELEKRDDYKIGFFATCKSQLLYRFTSCDINHLDTLENIMLKNGIPYDNSLNIFNLPKNYTGVKYYYPITENEYSSILEQNAKNDLTLSIEELKCKYDI